MIPRHSVLCQRSGGYDSEQRVSVCIQVFPKDRIRGIYDGSIFYLTAQRLEDATAKQL